MADFARGTVISVAEISFHDSSLKSAITNKKQRLNEYFKLSATVFRLVSAITAATFCLRACV